MERKRAAISYRGWTAAIKRHPIVASAVGGAVLCVALVLGVTGLLRLTRSATIPAQVITVHEGPGDGLPMTTVGPNMLNWTFVDHPGYDNAYTEYANKAPWNGSALYTTPRDTLAYADPGGTSGFWNGFITSKHVVLDADIVRFLGYQEPANTDSFFTNAYTNAFDAMTFTVTPSNLNFHTFSESGFMFNGTLTGTNYTGYMLMLKNSTYNTGTMSVYLLYCNNTSLVTSGTTAPGCPTVVGNTTNGRTLLAIYGTGILNSAVQPIDIRLEREASGAFRLYLDGILKNEISSTTTPPLQSTASGFGFFTSYFSHNCTILSAIQYDNVTFTGQFAPEEARTRVQFREYGTDKIIETDQTKTYWAGVYYSVATPVTIDPMDGGAPYVYLCSNPPDLDPLLFTPFKTTGESLVTLYYERQSTYVEKHASVGGVAYDGSPLAPAGVSVNGIIDYNIDINNTGAAAALGTTGTGVIKSNLRYGGEAGINTVAYYRWAGTNLDDVLKTPSNALGFQSSYRLRAQGASGTPTSGSQYAHAIQKKLTNVPPGTYRVYVDFNTNIQQGASGLIMTTSGAVQVRGMTGVTNLLTPSPPPNAALNTPASWGTQLGTYTMGANANLQTILDETNRLLGTITVGPSGEAYVSLGIFAPKSTTALSTTATSYVDSNILLRGVTLEPLTTVADAGVSFTGAYNRWAGTNLVDALTPATSGTTYQSTYRLSATGNSGAPAAGTFHTQAIQMTLTGVPAGVYTVYADYDMSIQQGVNTMLVTTANAGLVRGMVSGSSILTPSPPVNAALTNTWGTQLSTFTATNAITVQTLPTVTKQRIGTVTVGPSGNAYVALAIFAPKSTTQLTNATTNWIQSIISMRGVSLERGYYTYNDTANLTITQAGGHGASATATLSNATSTTPAAYQSQYRLVGTNQPNEAFYNIVQARVSNVPAGTYKVYVDVTAGLYQSVANLVTNTSLRGYANTTGYDPLPPTGSPGPWTTTATWGKEYVSRCAFDYGAITNPQRVAYNDFFDSNMQLVTVGPSGEVFVSVGMFGDCAGWPAATSRTMDSFVYLRGIRLVPYSGFEVTDILPGGLTYVAGSAVYKDGSGNALNPATDLGLTAGYPIITTVNGAVNLVWEFNSLPAGVTSIQFQAKAEGAAPSSTGNMYVNVATLLDARTSAVEKTNTTYHSNRFLITEMFHSYDLPSYLIKSTKHTLYDNNASNITYYPGWTNYSNVIKEHGTDTGEFRTWRYYGYSLDNGPIVKGEPNETIWYSGAVGGWNYINASHTIHFYFVEDVKITVRYLDLDDPVLKPNGDGIKPTVSMLLPAYQNWDLSVSHMRPWDNWVYQGHDVDKGPYAPTPYLRGYTFDAMGMGIDHEFWLYFREEFDYLPPVKNAYVNGSSTPQNGSADDPVPVPNNGKITYELEIYNSNVPYPPESQLVFDTVFALDWTDSMGGTIGGMSARAYGAELIDRMGSQLLGLNADNTVSVVCANTGTMGVTTGNSNNPAYVNLKLDTPFVDATRFVADIETPLLALPGPGSGPNDIGYIFSDNAQLLHAAIDKLAGDDTVKYGSNKEALDDHYVEVRDTFTHLPVIVLISDFRMDGTYWSTAMQAQADYFTSIYPYGILMTIRLDHSGNASFSTPLQDGFMDGFIDLSDKQDWAFKKFGSATSITAAFTEAFERLEGSPSVPGLLPTPGPLVIKDIVPDGLVLDVGSIRWDAGVSIAPGFPTYDPLTREITWKFSLGTPKMMLHLEFDATMVPSDDVFENKANVLWPTGETEFTNSTYHCYFPAEKNAYINGARRPKNGKSSTEPYVVREDDEIKYTIDLYNSPPDDPKYDVVFVLDWSASMSDGLGASPPPSEDSRLEARDVIKEMSRNLFDGYPNSRVAVMGLNTPPSGEIQFTNPSPPPPMGLAPYGNSTNRGDLYLQYDTAFVGPSGYTSVIDAAFATSSTYTADSNYLFMDAAIEKMKGNSTAYGGNPVWVSPLNGYTETPTPVPVRNVVPRDEVGVRIPVIVLMSDFQWDSDHTFATFWSQMNTKATEFKTAFSNGILLAARWDTQHNVNGQRFSNLTAFNRVQDDNAIQAMVDIGAGMWDWAKLTAAATPTYAQKAALIWDMIKAKAPPPDPVVVTDEVPEGVELDEPSISHGGTYDPVSRTITWDLSKEPAGAIKLTFKAVVTEPGPYENTAHIIYSSGLEEDTNTTYHLWFPAKKNAYINGSLTPENGTDTAPVKVEMNDKITYGLDLYKPEGQYGALEYDLIFVLDWSASMHMSDMDDSKLGGPTSAREYCRDLVLDLSKDLFDVYPDSRISVMGLNTWNNIAPTGNCSNDPSSLFLQIDTPFVTKTDYTTVIENAYNYEPAFTMDDNAQFLAAAVDKMMGIDTVPYGASNGTSATTPLDPTRLPQNGPYYVQARDSSDPDEMARTPIIVLLSDFQMTEAAGGFNTTNPYENYWTDSMKDQSDRYFTEFPDGILLTVRVDHSSNAPYATAVYNKLMKTNVAPAGHENWGFTDVPVGKPYLDALQDIEDLILDRAPPAVPYIVTDKVPEGLEVDEPSITHGGVYDPVTRIITWDLTEDPIIGEFTLFFDVTTKDPTLYENKAHVIYSDKYEEDTNTTYHLLDMFKLHIRQIVIDPLSGLQQPVMGYYTLLNSSQILPLTSDSLSPGYPFTNYTLKPNAANKEYTLTDIVPQYYELLGHIQNNGDKELPDPGGHPKTGPLTDPPVDLSTLNGKIKLDYSATGEIWITVYITPEGKPGLHQTSVETNKFGTVFKNP